MIVDRKGALGDMLMMTPALRELRRRRPDEFIGVKTIFPDVFKNSPYVDCATPVLHRAGEHVVNLNGVYEKDFGRHPVAVYAEKIVGDCSFESLNLELFPSESDRVAVDDWWSRNISDSSPVIVVHFGVTWVPLNGTELERAIEELSKAYTIVLVGRRIPHKEYYPQNHHLTVNLVDAEWSIHKLNWLIQKADYFLGTDTGVMHIAAATTTPIVCMYSFVHPQFRMPFRNGVPFEPVVGKLDLCDTPFCAEKHKRMTPSGDFAGVRCPRQYVCSKSITAEMILGKIEKVKRQSIKPS